MLALPMPATGGTSNELRSFLNVRGDNEWVLIVAWLFGAYSPSGPYPILAVHGEQGSAKSTACRVLRKLIDPNKGDVRTSPRNEHDLAIAASNSRVLSFDNVSWVRDWLSDALCRVASGSGLGTRQLYTDDEEMIFNFQRPILAYCPHGLVSARFSLFTWLHIHNLFRWR